MRRQPARLFLFVTAATLLVVGLSLSQTRLGRESQDRKGPDGRVASGPRVAPGSDPRPASSGQAAPTPPADPTPPAKPEGKGSSGTELKYTVPAGMAPVTERNICRHQGHRCCEETRDWCLSEGLVWQDCKKCYCGSQCMGPSLTD